ncbi:MAG: 3-deoxy-D-manno-octulosonic acid transferase [Deltaproteobacteria bacterium]|nr:3-deoxy-D-manno-octulosonic acid transferase [Deltaproteobacteria bacterium]MBW1910627.1 3-deoxy-D-manno-octulosonic acid transferase [Deltaproteobacteria bacterium]MBW2033652.1 3-deoxy-D-manno-octulosonic acid transferase [Deltaproteobacteria bacterium]MBW2168097.1 3-deoxy-D-manno-octulosonic acid transferase [Deltaproteobacteria bacterium]
MFLLPAFWGYTRITGRHGQHLKERLGFIPEEAVQGLSGYPRIWIHAVSLGEVKVADAIIKVLRRIIPGCSVIVSMFTEHGRKMAKETFKDDVPVIYAPIDFWGSVRKALFTVRPDVMVFLETEIWPAWLFEAHRMGIKTALINGRISVRSIGGYLKLRPFFREVLENLDVFSMILEEDAARIRSMGADPRKIEINGNAKYDLLGSSAEPVMEAEMRQVLNLDPSQRVFVAGSTREGEEEMILDVYEKILERFPETILIIVPRHIERTQVIAFMIERRGLNCQHRTDLGEDKARRTEKVVIINTFGELFRVYSIGTLVFCGASLVPLGGQNPLEPAIWGKVVFYGPSMEDFLDAKALLEEARAAVPISGPEMLAEKAIWFLEHPEALNEYGERAKEAALKNQGAAEKHARVIKRLLDMSFKLSNEGSM